jgi:branched-subunit amino acid aminotransferase/4-amino-4-deoxychorismate lyase
MTTPRIRATTMSSCTSTAIWFLVIAPSCRCSMRVSSSGDGVWEGIRVSRGRPAFLDRHLDRLYDGATAIMLDIGRSRQELAAAIEETLRANSMTCPTESTYVSW